MNATPIDPSCFVIGSTEAPRRQSLPPPPDTKKPAPRIAAGQAGDENTKRGKSSISSGEVNSDFIHADQARNAAESLLAGQMEHGLAGPLELPPEMFEQFGLSKIARVIRRAVDGGARGCHEVLLAAMAEVPDQASQDTVRAQIMALAETIVPEFVRAERLRRQAQIVRRYQAQQSARSAASDFCQTGEGLDRLAGAVDALRQADCGKGFESHRLMSTESILTTNISDDPNAMIGYERRFLSKGGSWVIVGPSGIGKSTLVMGLAVHAASGHAWHGLTFRKALKVLVVQAENDEGDLKEMIVGTFSALGDDIADRAGRNIEWMHETSLTGIAFCERLEALIRETGAELVVIDPLLSYVGDDISQQKVASTFLRNWLQPVLDRTGAIVIIVHHTGKTPTDSKSRQNWSESDFAYLGIGSSEITNWARAVAVLTPFGKDSGRFRFLVAKRGNRSGMVDHFSGEKTSSILLKHSEHGLGWVQCTPPTESEAIPRGGGRQQSLTTDDVLRELGDASLAIRKGVLLARLEVKHRVSKRTARERVDSTIELGFAHVASIEPRKGGGRPTEWIRSGPEAKGNNQRETSK